MGIKKIISGGQTGADRAAPDAPHAAPSLDQLMGVARLSQTVEEAAERPIDELVAAHEVIDSVTVQLYYEL
jgi:hypothetical protein